MSDPIDDNARPAKRARLDDGSAPTPTLSTTSAPAPSSPAIDEDIEREIRAGITEYVCPNNRGFTGTLKQRYTDFLVNEIGLDGKVLHLTSTEVPRRKKANGQVVEKKSDGKGLEIKEEKVEGDKEMVDVRNGEGGEKEVQDAPEQDGAAGKQNGGAKEEPKPAAEEEVRLCCERFHTTVLNILVARRRRPRNTTLDIRRRHHQAGRQARQPDTEKRTAEGERLQGHHHTTHDRQGEACTSPPLSAAHIPEPARKLHGVRPDLTHQGGTASRAKGQQ